MKRRLNVMYEYLEDAMEPENRSIKEKTIFPSKSTFKGRRWDGWDKQARERTVENTDGRLVMTHNDADGLVSGALFMDYFGKDNVNVLTVDYENIEEVLEYINENSENINEFFVADLNLDEVPSVIEDIVDEVMVFKWFDHHEWGEKKEILSNMGVDVTINKDKCGAGIVFDYLKSSGYNYTNSVEETVELTEDHDLWNHNMKNIQIGGESVCISKIFSQLAFYSDDDEFMENILDYGLNFMDYEGKLLRGDKENGFLGTVVREGKKKRKYIVNNETEIKEIGDYSVAFIYGRASPGNMLEELSDVDILIQAKPAYPAKVSIRSRDSFKECHLIAERLGGGGHEQASACKPEIAQELEEFIEYLYKHGSPLLEEVEEVVRDHLEE